MYQGMFGGAASATKGVKLNLNFPETREEFIRARRDEPIKVPEDIMAVFEEILGPYGKAWWGEAVPMAFSVTSMKVWRNKHRYDNSRSPDLEVEIGNWVNDQHIDSRGDPYSNRYYFYHPDVVRHRLMAALVKSRLRRRRTVVTKNLQKTHTNHINK
jgi:hypothetical protein